MKRYNYMIGLLTAALTMSAGARAEQAYCREYTKNVSVVGAVQQANGTACQQPDDAWKILQDEAIAPEAAPSARNNQAAYGAPQVTYVPPRTRVAVVQPSFYGRTYRNRSSRRAAGRYNSSWRYAYNNRHYNRF